MKIIKISTETCGPCKNQKKEMEKLTGIEIVNIDAEEDDESVEKYNIRSVPTIIVLDDSDNELKRWTGFTLATEIQGFINKQ